MEVAVPKEDLQSIAISNIRNGLSVAHSVVFYLDSLNRARAGERISEPTIDELRRHASPLVDRDFILLFQGITGNRDAANATFLPEDLTLLIAAYGRRLTEIMHKQ